METYRIIRSDAVSDGTQSLQHYGILGMKWGVRRTPEQLGHHRIKKGTTMYRVTSRPDEMHTGHAYVSYLPPDRDRYRWGLHNSTRQQYEKKYVLTKDLNVPSRSELTDVIYQTIKSDVDRKLINEVANTMTNQLYLSGGKWKRFFDQDTIDKITGEIHKTNASYNEGLKIIKRYGGNNIARHTDRFIKEISEESPVEVMADVMMSLDQAGRIRASIIDELKRRGYNAIVDEHDVGGLLSWDSRRGVEPLMVFDRQDVLSEVNTTPISEKMAERSDKRYHQWLKMANQHRKNNQW